MTAAAPHPDECLPPDDEAFDFLFDFAAEQLARQMTDDPAKMTVARRAAKRIIACHRPTDEADLQLVVQMAAFGLASLRTLGIACSAGTAPRETQRLLSCATGFSRAEERLRKLRQQREPVPISDYVPAVASPEPTPQPPPQTIAAQPPGDAPSDQPTPDKDEQDRQAREAWAAAADDAVVALLSAAPSMPLEQRQEALHNARLLSDAACDVRAGRPMPTDLRQAG